MANKEIEIAVDIEVSECNEARTNYLVFAVHAPTNWDLAENATVRVVADNYERGGGRVDEQLTVMPASEIAIVTGSGRWDNAPWKEGLLDRFGKGGNLKEGTEWVVFVSKTQFVFEVGDTVAGTVCIKFKTTDEDVKVDMGYFFCGMEAGMDDHDIKWEVMEVTGGSNPPVDYTIGPGIMNGSVTEVNSPAKPVADNPIEIESKIKILGSYPGGSPMAFGVLGLKSWDLADNATVTLTTSNYDKGDVTDEQMTAMPANFLEPVSQKAWSEAFMDYFGCMDNYNSEMFEWVVFQSATSFVLDGSGSDIDGTVKINFTPGGENSKLTMAYGFCGSGYGFDTEHNYSSAATARTFVVLGGSDPGIVDYRKNPSVEYPELTEFTTTPSVFRFGDIFTPRFDAAGQDYEQLRGETKVYLYAKAECSDGNEREVAKTLMERLTTDGTVWQNYIYPPHFFNLPEGVTIEKIIFRFGNERGDIVVDNNGQDYVVTQSAE